MPRIKNLRALGQSLWLDYIRRRLITSGELKTLVNDGLMGITSNPSIFEKAIGGSADYDDSLRQLLTDNPHADAAALYERLAIEDIRLAADVLRSVYRQTAGADGFVSLEVSPELAHDTARTIAEARRLWQAVDRPNLMIKVPATPAGLPAIEALLAAGINVNVTLIFSLKHYQAVARAYQRGIERLSRPDQVASVASFFISRVDSRTDQLLDADGRPEALALKGKIAIANARTSYQWFRQFFRRPRWRELARRGARLQRPLWASTSTKNPAYPDLLYVESLIGPDTVNTVPPATLNAFRDHGLVRAALETGLEEARESLKTLAGLGIDLTAVGDKLQDEGVAQFKAAFAKLMTALKEKRQRLLTRQLARQSLILGSCGPAVKERLAEWQKARFAKRLFEKDYNLWSSDPAEIADRLGWLNLPEIMHEQLDRLTNFAAQIKAAGFRQVILLGMGGSSLAPEVFQNTFGAGSGYPPLAVLDSTHPRAVRAVTDKIKPAETFFIVASKSGTTLETLSFFKYFWNLLAKKGGSPGRQFAAITDPGTPLEKLARRRGFRQVFSSPADVGGRFSALTVFGLVPAALIGLDVHKMLDRAWTILESCAFCVPESDNPGLTLGAALGELARAGRDKVTFVASPSLVPFPVWLEQLIAESTGKSGRGIVPVANEELAPPAAYGADRFFVYLELAGEENPQTEQQLRGLEKAGHPVARLRLRIKEDIAGEMFRWEVAVAAAGAAIGIQPFNQPDVQLAKDLAKKAMTGGAVGGIEKEVAVSDPEQLKKALSDWLAQKKAGDYFALQAYLPPEPATSQALSQLRLALRDKTRLATTLGYGPRFLHSTGQLHKGGANNCLCLQIVDGVSAADLPVPETDYTFGRLIQAQAAGDYQALKQRGRRLLRVRLEEKAAADLDKLKNAL